MAKTGGKAKRSDKTAWVIVSIVGVLGLILIGFWSTFQFGEVTGDEFSPDTFTRRSFSYYRIPLIQLQVTAIDRNDTTGSLEKHLKSNNLITVQNKANPTWHTIQAAVGTRELPVGDAAILFRYLDHATAPDGEQWLDWTTGHKPEAKVLWPLVAQLARDQLYLYIPELLALVEEAGSPPEFTSLAQQYAADSYSQVAQARLAMGYRTEAVALYKTALSIQSDHAAAKTGLAKAEATPSKNPAKE